MALADDETHSTKDLRHCQAVEDGVLSQAFEWIINSLMPILAGRRRTASP